MICDGCRHQEQFEYACAVFGDKLRAILLIRELNSLSVDIIYVHSVTPDQCSISLPVHSSLLQVCIMGCCNKRPVGYNGHTKYATNLTSYKPNIYSS